MDSSLLEVYRKIQKDIKLAKDLGKCNDYIRLLKVYHSIVTGFERACMMETGTKQKNSLKERILEYSRLRKDTYQKMISNNFDFLPECQQQVSVAQDFKTSNMPQEALNQYVSALELLEILLLESTNKSVILMAKKLIGSSLVDAEMLKNQLALQEKIDTPQSPHPSSFSKKPENNLSTELSLLSVSKEIDRIHNKKLSNSELDVISSTSYINGLGFLPWEPNDASCYYDSGKLFHDPHGKVKLSDIQLKDFGSWQRLSSIYKSPFTLFPKNSINITQDVVTDCSLVVSIIVCAEYAARFNKNLIMHLVYPQDLNNNPIFNPSGKYVVKLFLNGLWRKVEIDDYFPVSIKGELMCTYSADEAILIPIIEKAYLKVMGGYGFPGSNSSVDLNSLTSWIPEHIFTKDFSYDKDLVWKKIIDGFISGNLLLTIATGELSRSDRLDLGLVSCHAYAILDVYEDENICMFKVKNPWGQLSWKGKCSPLDTNFWTAEMREKLDYDPNSLFLSNNGVFWIDNESVIEHFEAFHLNWNPGTFNYNDVIYFNWENPKLINGKQGTEKHDTSNNPQFNLTLKPTSNQSKVWILISKHVLATELNMDYISLHAYRNCTDESLKTKKMLNKTSSSIIDLRKFRILEAGQAYAMTDYVNSSHVMLQLELNSRSDNNFTLVVLQQNQIKDLQFSLFVYSSCDFSLAQIPNYKYTKTLTSQWTNRLSGGNSLCPEYLNNPQFSLKIFGDSSGLISRPAGYILLHTLYNYPIQIRVFKSGYLISTVSSVNTIVHSGNYKAKFCSVKFDELVDEAYTILVSTFEPMLFGSFNLTVCLSHSFELKALPREGSGMRHKIVSGEWINEVNSMGSINNKNYFMNPKYKITLSCPTAITARIYTIGDDPKQSVNLSLFVADLSYKPIGHPIATSGSYINSPQGAIIQKTLLQRQEFGYLMYPSTWDSKVSCKYTIHFYSDFPVEIDLAS